MHCGQLFSQVILSCMGNKIARKVPASVVAAAGPEDKSRIRHAYQTLSLEQLVYIHPGSVLFQDEPEFILYQELFEGNKIFCRNVLELKPDWIAKYAPQHCSFSAPLDTPEPRFDCDSGKVMCHRTSTCGESSFVDRAVVLSTALHLIDGYPSKQLTQTDRQTGNHVRRQSHGQTD